jgi:hypothetical protein
VIITRVADDADLAIDEAAFLLVGLGAVIFFEGWLSVLYKHLLGETLGTSFITAAFSLIIGKIGTVRVFHHGFCCGRVSIIGLRLLYGARFRQKFTPRGCHWIARMFA